MADNHFITENDEITNARLRVQGAKDQLRRARRVSEYYREAAKREYAAALAELDRLRKAED